LNGIGQLIEAAESGFRQLPAGVLQPVLVALLGFVFAWSGIAKARSPWVPALAIVNFGVAKRPSLRLAWAVALGEIGLAAMLLISPVMSSSFAPLAAGSAAVVLLAFSLLIARALRSGRSFACACFGNGDDRLSNRTLARACALGVLAVACAAVSPQEQPLSVADLLLTWCAAASLLGTSVLLLRARELVRLPSPSHGGVRA
jgi:Methylamine utilisation protein MauE